GSSRASGSPEDGRSRAGGCTIVLALSGAVKARAGARRSAILGPDGPREGTDRERGRGSRDPGRAMVGAGDPARAHAPDRRSGGQAGCGLPLLQRRGPGGTLQLGGHDELDRKSTRLNSSHVSISYAVFCLKKKK